MELGWTDAVGSGSEALGDAGGRVLRVQGLAAGDTRVELVPVQDLRLAEAPAKINFTALHDAIEVAESVRAFQHDTELGQLIDISRELFLLGLELGLGLRQFFRIRIARRSS